MDGDEPMNLQLCCIVDVLWLELQQIWHYLGGVGALLGSLVGWYPFAMVTLGATSGVLFWSNLDNNIKKLLASSHYKTAVLWFVPL